MKTTELCVAGEDSPFLSPKTKADVDAIEARLLPLPQVPIPLTHSFAPGVYLREVEMPAGSLIIGHEHKTEHFNIILSGHATVMMNGVVQHIHAPAIIRSLPGVRKVLYIHETMRWATIHPTTETDIEILEDALVIKSAAFLAHSHADAVLLLKNLEEPIVETELCPS